MWNFQGLIKKEVDFPRVFVFGLGIFKGSNTVLWNMQELNFVLSRISRSSVKKIKIQGKFSKKYILNLPCLDFFWNSPFS